MKEDREIAIVEGEKDADNLWRLGIPATCNFDGTTDVIKNPKAKPKWKADYSEALRGARIVVFNDNDPPGYAHADAVCKLSLGVAKRVRRLDLKPTGRRYRRAATSPIGSQSAASTRRRSSRR